MYQPMHRVQNGLLNVIKVHLSQTLKTDAMVITFTSCILNMGLYYWVQEPQKRQVSKIETLHVA